MGIDTPDDGENFSGQWFKGKKDDKDKDIPLAHKNARYAVTLPALKNCDSELENPEGVELAAIMYGGRDAKAYVPCQQAFDWEHGIVSYGASLETETTFAIVGKEGIPEINLMAIQDFVAVSLGKYVRNNLDFGRKLEKPPLVFGVNYFLRDKEGKFVNGVRDKHIWVKWMELRVHGDAKAVRTPTGFIPFFDDLRQLFKEVLDKDYSRDDYIRQFTIRVEENLAKLDRVEKFFTDNVANVPQAVYDTFSHTGTRLKKAAEKFGTLISPFDLPIE
jgi:phosphoenolpyruvate carboxykinase (GTP)